MMHLPPANLPAVLFLRRAFMKVPGFGKRGAVDMGAYTKLHNTLERFGPSKHNGTLCVVVLK